LPNDWLDKTPLRTPICVETRDCLHKDQAEERICVDSIFGLVYCYIAR